MTEEELRRMIREALAASRGEGQDEEGLRTAIGMEQKEYPISYAKQLPQGLLNVSENPMPGTDGKQVMLQGNIPLPVGSLNVQGGIMPTYGQKNAGVTYSVPVGEGTVSLSGNVSTDPKVQGSAKSVGATYSKQLLDELYFTAYINQLLNQGSKGQNIGVGIRGLF